jgi:hypothetical protein
MKDLYILENISENEIKKIIVGATTKIVAIDFTSHKILKKYNIKHQLIDNFLTDTTREDIFRFCASWLNKYEEDTNSEFKVHGINLISIIDRNELLELLMEITPKIVAINNIIKNEIYETIFTSSELYELFLNMKIKSKIKKFNNIQEEVLSFENINIPINFKFFKTKISIQRKKYHMIKKIIEKLCGKIFGLRKIDSNKKKVILIEFDPEIYCDLLKEIDFQGFQPVLINNRKSTISSLQSIKILKNTNSCVIIAEDWLNKDEIDEKNILKSKFLEIIHNLDVNSILFSSFVYLKIDLTDMLKEKIRNMLIQRIDEYLTTIFIAKSIQSRNDILGVITVNFSGETEKIFLKIGNEFPITHLQHAFANYIKSISYLDILDDFHYINHKIAVWGDVVKNYLVNEKGMSQEKIIVSGSPKYDSYKIIKQNKKFTNEKKKILVTLRPIITHVEGLRIDLYNRYEKTIEKLINISKDYKNIEIKFKLHPQQNKSNQILINMIKDRSKIEILQFEPIRELMYDCDLHVNIATDNFDASSVVLEAMILEKPTLNIQLQKNDIIFEFIKNDAIKTIHYDSDIGKEVINLMMKDTQEKLLEKSQIFLSEYLKNQGSASKILVESLMRNK